MTGKRAFKHSLMKVSVVQEQCLKASSRVSTEKNEKKNKKNNQSYKRTICYRIMLKDAILIVIKENTLNQQKAKITQFDSVSLYIAKAILGAENMNSSPRPQ